MVYSDGKPQITQLFPLHFIIGLQNMSENTSIKDRRYNKKE